MEDCGVSDGSPMAQKWDNPKSARATLDAHREGWCRADKVQGCGAQR
jgi:hypothetical protein